MAKLHSTNRLNDLLETDFKGGTLVEYKKGFGFGVEWGRGNITEVFISDEELSINTDREAYLYLSDICYIGNVGRCEDVFYLRIPSLFNYALAPKGIDIPKKSDYD